MTGSVPRDEGMSKDEAQVYDRQIRLWGFEAQEKLRTSSILVCGLSGLGAEVVKNLMLCGIKAMTLMDSEVVSQEDYDSNFLLAPDSCGQNRAACSYARAQALNPMVKCTVEELSIESKTSDYITQYDMIVLMDHSYNVTNKWNKICREKGVRFVAGSVFGWIGYGFFDFNGHNFLIPIKKREFPLVGLDGGQGALGDSNNAITLDDDQFVKESLSYSSFEDAFNVDWAEKMKKRVSRVIPPCYPPLRAMLRAQEMNKLTGDNQKDYETVHQLFIDEVKSLKLSEEIANSSPLEKTEYYFGSQLSPVCAAIGGLIGQEAIKALSENKEPLKNIFLYSAFDTAGILLQAPPA